MKDRDAKTGTYRTYRPKHFAFTLEMADKMIRRGHTPNYSPRHFSPADLAQYFARDWQ